MENPLVKFRKIPLEDFIDILMELYDRGADYIDIVGSPTELGQDFISVIVRTEYIDPENNGFDDADDGEELTDEELFSHIEEQPKIRIELSEDTLNDLI